VKTECDFAIAIEDYSMGIAESRNQYGNNELQQEHRDADPLRQFVRWFSDAESAGEPEAQGMVLGDGRCARHPFVSRGSPARPG